LREVISAGFLMIDEGRLLIENMIGTAIVREARAPLTALYEITGRPGDARFVSAETDAAVPMPDRSQRNVVSLEEAGRGVRRAILDTTQLRGLRWEMLLSQFALEPCTDLRQVIFGPDAEYRFTLNAARQSLVRRQSDSLLFALIERDKVHAVTAEGSRGRAVRTTRPVGRMITALTGQRHLEACLSLFGVH